MHGNSEEQFWRDVITNGYPLSQWTVERSLRPGLLNAWHAAFTPARFYCSYEGGIYSRHIPRTGLSFVKKFIWSKSYPFKFEC
jgi:hypothetical protein